MPRTPDRSRVFLNGGAISEPGPRGERITDARFLLLFNAYPDPVTFVLPEVRFGPEWEIVINTDCPRIPAIHSELPALAAKAATRGNRPFGDRAVLPDGQIPALTCGSSRRAQLVAGPPAIARFIQQPGRLQRALPRRGKDAAPRSSARVRQPSAPKPRVPARSAGDGR